MKRRKLRPLVIYLFLTVCLLFAGILFVMRKNRETAAPDQTQVPDAGGSDNPVSSVDNTDHSGSGQNTPGQTDGSQKQNGKGNSADPPRGTELPEIEIPAETNQPVSSAEPQESHPAETDQPVSQSENTPEPEQEPQPENPVTETPEPAAPTATPDNPVSQPENTPEPETQEPESGGILTNENGDIMLPEVP